VDDRIQLLVDVLDHAFQGRGWHGTTLTGALRGVTPGQASWRAAPDRHNIWELALHTAYWKYVVKRRLAGDGGRGDFPRSPSNWPAPPARATLIAWRADLRILKQAHADLRATVLALPPKRLAARSPAGKWTYAELIYGVAAHDLYHTGQIQLLKRLMRKGAGGGKET
jgi:uncharacterized damage-inducible protein DinB